MVGIIQKVVLMEIIYINHLMKSTWLKDMEIISQWNQNHLPILNQWLIQIIIKNKKWKDFLKKERRENKIMRFT